MRLCVISDTHIPDRAAGLPRRLLEELRAADQIVHAGDFTIVQAYESILRLNKLIAVRGNIDEPALAERLERSVTFRVGKFKVGVTHGFGKAESVFDNIRKEFDASYHLVIFGHSHAPCEEKIGRTLYFNPGSPTDTIFAPYNSYGIIDIGTTIAARIIKL